MTTINRRIDEVWEREFTNIEQSLISEARECGLLDALIREELVPEIEFVYSSGNVNSCAKLIARVNHIRSPAPHEWTLQMLCDAALVHLRVEEISLKYGFTLVDAHFGNVIFRYGQPLFIDLGSFARSTSKRFWQASQEYISEIRRPIDLCAKGYGRFVHLSIEKGSIARDRLWTLSHPTMFKILKLIKLDNLAVVFRERLALVGVFNLRQGFLSYSMGRGRPETFDVLVRRFPQKNLNFIQILLKLLDLMTAILKPILVINLSREIKKITKIKKSHNYGYWSDYYQGKDTAVDQKWEVERFDTHFKLIRSLNIRSATDMGGNTGGFVAELIRQGLIEFGCVLDSDESVLEIGRSHSIKENIPISFACVDLTTLPSPDRVTPDRFASDLLCALGLIHHMCLRYRMSFHHALSNICSYPFKYLMIEFMPLGLTADGSSSKLPTWYEEKTFEEELIKFVKIIKREKLNKSRVLYLCEANKLDHS